MTHPERALYGGAWLLPVAFCWCFIDPPPWCAGRVALATGYGLGVLGGALLTAAGFLAARAKAEVDAFEREVRARTGGR